MRITELIQRRIRERGGAVDIAGDVNAAIAGNVGERPSTATRVSSKQLVRTRPKKRKEA